MTKDDTTIPTKNRAFVLKKPNEVGFEDRPVPDPSKLRNDS
jgi:hypothetical protein